MCLISFYLGYLGERKIMDLPSLNVNVHPRLLVQLHPKNSVMVRPSPWHACRRLSSTPKWVNLSAVISQATCVRLLDQEGKEAEVVG